VVRCRRPGAGWYRADRRRTRSSPPWALDGGHPCPPTVRQRPARYHPRMPCPFTCRVGGQPPGRSSPAPHRREGSPPTGGRTGPPPPRTRHGIAGRIGGSRVRTVGGHGWPPSSAHGRLERVLTRDPPIRPDHHRPTTTARPPPARPPPARLPPARAPARPPTHAATRAPEPGHSPGRQLMCARMPSSSSRLLYSMTRRPLPARL